MSSRKPASVKSIHLHCDASRLQESLSAFSEFAERSPQVCERFVDRIGGLPQLVCLNLEAVSAGTGHYRVSLEPSDCLLEFLAAMGTGEFDGL